MGKATIISEYGDGKYSVRPEPNTARAQAEVTRLTNENANIDATLAQLVGEIQDAQLDYYLAQDYLAAAINHGTDAEIAARQDDVTFTNQTLLDLQHLETYQKLKKTSNLKRIEWLNTATATPAPVAAWCADHTEGLTGTVGTIELGRQKSGPIIRPGYDGGATYDAERDGALVPVQSQTPAAVFYNLAMRPGADKWKPIYRVGELTAIDSEANTGEVSLDELISSHQSINVNPADTVLDAVPFSYMSCNYAAFQVGDRVVVEFDNHAWETPRIIGFEAEPRLCALRLVTIHQVDPTFTVGGDRYDVAMIMDPLTFEIFSQQTIQAVSAGYEYHISGQFMNSDWWGLLPHPSFSLVLPDRHAIEVTKNGASIFTINDLEVRTAIPSPSGGGTTNDNYRAGDGAFAAHGGKLFVPHYLSEFYWFTGLCVKTESRFYVYSESGELLDQRVLHSWEDSDIYDYTFETPVMYDFREAIANGHGVLTLVNYNGTGLAIIYNHDGTVMATVDSSISDVTTISISASESLFSLLYMDSGVVKIYNAAGIQCNQVTMTLPARTADPEGYIPGRTVTEQHHVSIEENQLSTVSTWLYWANNFDPQRSSNLTQIIAETYELAPDGSIGSKLATSEVIVKSAFQGCRKAARYQ
jgi:hypothetical protein